MKSKTAKVPVPYEWPDNNYNGVPDAFENRKPISQIFAEQDERDRLEQEVSDNGTVILEIEIKRRVARKGEFFLLAGEIYQEKYGRADALEGPIIRRIIAAPKDFLEALTAKH